MSSEPAPETIIREALLPKNEHHHRCSSQVGHECDCYYGSRRDGRLAHDALDALVRERDEARAENERLRRWINRLDEIHEARKETDCEHFQCDTCDALAAAQESPADESKLSSHIRSGIDVIRQQRCCGSVSPDGSRVCIKDIDHDDAHGWQEPLADPFAGLVDVYHRVLPEVQEFVEKYERMPVDLAEATNGPQEPPACTCPVLGLSNTTNACPVHDAQEPPAEGGDRSPNDCAVHGPFDSDVCPSCKGDDRDE